MKSYVLCTIIGSGTFEDGFRPKVADYGVDWVVAIAPDHQTNPNKQWVLCVVAGESAVIQSMSTDSGITLLPFSPYDLDTRWLDLGNRSTRQSIANAIKTRTGVTIPRDDPRALREIVTEIGRTVDTSFHADNLDVTEGGAPPI